MPSLSRGEDAAPELPASPLRLDGRPLQSAEDLAEYLGVEISDMLRLLYKAPDHERYRHFEIPKRSGGLRRISAPHGLLRAMQDKLHVDFKRLYDAHPRAHGFIEGRSIATNADEHIGKRWVLNVDLVDFFPTINFGRVRGLFMKPPFEMAPAAATVAAQIVTYRNGLPQGAPTSPVLSNFIAATLDRRLLRLARQHKLAYSRYADDITLSTNLTQFPPAIALREQITGGGFKVVAGDALEQAIAASGFAINGQKVRIQGHGVQQTVTGLVVNQRINVERERIRRIRAMLHAWEKFGLEAAAAEHFAKYRTSRRRVKRAHGRAFRNIVYGQLSFVRMIRGRDDPVFLKLCSKVLDLDPNPSKFIRQMVFGADDFEIFISHAREDKAAIARPIHEACARLGLKAFLDEEHIGWGESFTKKINTALGAARTVVAVVSSNSVGKEWPLAEVNTALALEISGQKRVLPVMVGEPDLSKLPLIRSKNWHVWDGDADRVARVLRELMGASGGKPSRGAQGAAGSVPQVPRSAGLNSSQPGPWDAASKPSPPVVEPPKPRRWLDRLFRGD
ncbi:MAG: TIR domain-containing protein [Hyphomicrobium sp.]|uniref:TIR domain-containing protein n=1 Tax=Hyphomicrobium sp. TaxID=82 RepID=UPI003D11B511